MPSARTCSPGITHDRGDRVFYYHYYRDYDPAFGAVLQSDPVGLRGGVAKVCAPPQIIMVSDLAMVTSVLRSGWIVIVKQRNGHGIIKDFALKIHTMLAQIELGLSVSHS